MRRNFTFCPAIEDPLGGVVKCDLRLLGTNRGWVKYVVSVSTTPGLVNSSHQFRKASNSPNLLFFKHLERPESWDASPDFH